MGSLTHSISASVTEQNCLVSLGRDGPMSVSCACAAASAAILGLRENHGFVMMVSPQQIGQLDTSHVRVSSNHRVYLSAKNSEKGFYRVPTFCSHDLGVSDGLETDFKRSTSLQIRENSIAIT